LTPDTAEKVQMCSPTKEREKKRHRTKSSEKGLRLGGKRTGCCQVIAGDLGIKSNSKKKMVVFKNRAWGELRKDLSCTTTERPVIFIS